MTNYVGDFAPSSLVVFAFTTVNSTGVPTALSSNPSAAVFQMAGSSAITAGVTLITTFGSNFSGLNMVKIDTSQDTIGYASGKDYTVAIVSGAVGTTNVTAYTVGHFSLTNRGPANNISGISQTNVVQFVGVSAGATNIDRSTRSICLGTVSNGSTTTTITISTVTPSMTTQSQFVGRIVNFDANTTTANLRGQSTNITASVTSSGGALTVTALTDAPVFGDTFSIT